MSEYALFAKRVGLVGIAQTILGLKGLIILPILTKTLGANDYGIWVQVLISVSILQPFILLGLNNSLLRFFSSKEKHEIVQGIITITCVTLAVGIVASITFYLLSDQIATILLHDKSSSTVFKIASPLLVTEALNVIALSSFRIFGQIKRYSAILLFGALLEIILISSFVLFGLGLIGAIISLLIARTIVLIVTLYLIFSYSGFTLPKFSMLKPFLIYGIPLISISFSDMIITSSDRLVIGFFMGASSVGIYSAAYGIGSIIFMFSSVIMYVLRPTIFKEFDEGRLDSVKMYLSYSWKYLLMFLIPSAFGLSILAESILANLTTLEFIPLGKFIVPLVVMSTVLNSTQEIFGVVLMIKKDTRIFSFIIVAAAILNVMLNILLVPYWGIIGAAATTLIAYAMLALVICYKSNKYINFDIKLNFMAKSLLSSVIMALLILAFNMTIFENVLLSVILGAISYFVVLFYLDGFDKDEKEFLAFYFKGAMKYL